MKIAVETTAKAPPEAVFAAMLDLERWPQTIRGVERVELLTPGPVAVGTRFRETRTMFGRSATEEMTVAELDPPRRLVLTAHSHGTDYVAVHTVEPEAGGARLRLVFEGRPATLAARLGALVMWPLAGKLRDMLRQDLDDIRRAAEAAPR